MKRIITTDESQTFGIGEKLAQTLKKGSVVALDGDLGVGKTILVKGLAHGLDIKEHILSPTFTLLRQYKGLNHFDVYRIEDIEELSEIGFIDYLNDDAITIIEWANVIKEILPKETIHILIERGENENDRMITIFEGEERA